MALLLTHDQPAAMPVVASVGALGSDSKYRAKAPVTNGAAIDVPDKSAYVF